MQKIFSIISISENVTHLTPQSTLFSFLSFYFFNKFLTIIAASLFIGLVIVIQLLITETKQAPSFNTIPQASGCPSESRRVVMIRGTRLVVLPCLQTGFFVRSSLDITLVRRMISLDNATNYRASVSPIWQTDFAVASSDWRYNLQIAPYNVDSTVETKLLVMPVYHAAETYYIIDTSLLIWSCIASPFGVYIIDGMAPNLFQPVLSKPNGLTSGIVWQARPVPGTIFFAACMDSARWMSVDRTNLTPQVTKTEFGNVFSIDNQRTEGSKLIVIAYQFIQGKIYNYDSTTLLISYSTAVWQKAVTFLSHTNYFVSMTSGSQVHLRTSDSATSVLSFGSWAVAGEINKLESDFESEGSKLYFQMAYWTGPDTQEVASVSGMTTTACSNNPDCAECFQNTDKNCVKCQLGKKLVQGKCISCSDGYYMSTTNGTCQPCLAPCVNCLGPVFSLCLSCQPGFTLDEERVCKRDCTPTQYYSYLDNQCYTCHSSCLSCDATKCTSCAQGKFLTGTGVCQQCHGECQTCSGGASNQCQSCPPGKQLLSGSCISCHESCQTCSGGASNQCTSCPPGKQLLQTNECITCHSDCQSCSGVQQNQCLSCPLGKFLVNGRCQGCHSSCKTCSGSQQDQCLSCEDGQYLKDGRCFSCDISQKTCYGGDFYRESLTCNPGFKLTKEKECRRECSSLEYWVKEDNSCASCSPACKECGPQEENKPRKCLECKDGFKFQPKLKQDFCYKICNDNQYYDEDENECYNCHFSCQGCSQRTQLDCKACKEGYLLQPDLSCKDSCQDGTFIDPKNQNKCISCHKSCKSCSSASKSACLSCYLDNPLYIDKSREGRCVDCAEDYNDFPSDCTRTKELQVSYLKQNSQDKQKNQWKLKFSFSEFPIDLIRFQNEVGLNNFRYNYVAIKVLTQNQSQKKSDKTKRVLQTEDYTFQFYILDDNKSVGISIILNNQEEDLEQITMQVKKEIWLYDQNNNKKPDLIVARRTYDFWEIAKASEASKEGAQTLKENKETTNSVAGVISGIAAFSGGAGIIGGVILSTIIGTFLGVLFKFFQVMDNIGNIKLVNVHYGPLLEQVFQIIESIDLFPELDSKTFMKGDKYYPAVFNKNLGKATDTYEEGFLFQTLPFGWFFYLIIFSIFRALNYIRRKWVSEIYDKQLKLILGKQKIMIKQGLVNLEDALKEQANKQKSLQRTFKVLNFMICVIFDLKSVLFNILVIDLSLGSLFVIAASDIKATIRLGNEALLSYFTAYVILIIISYDFFEQLNASLDAKLSKSDKKYLAYKEIFELKEGFKDKIRKKYIKQMMQEEKQGQIGDSGKYGQVAQQLGISESERPLNQSQLPLNGPLSINQQIIKKEIDEQEITKTNHANNLFRKEIQNQILGLPKNTFNKQKEIRSKVIQKTPKMLEGLQGTPGHEQPIITVIGLKNQFIQSDIQLQEPKYQPKIKSQLSSNSFKQNQDDGCNTQQNAQKEVQSESKTQMNLISSNIEILEEEKKFRAWDCKYDFKTLNEFCLRQEELRLYWKNQVESVKTNKWKLFFGSKVAQIQKLKNNGQAQYLKISEMKTFIIEKREVKFMDKKDVIQKRLQNSSLVGIDPLKGNFTSARIYNTMFLIRYVLFGTILIGMQNLQRAQIICLLIGQTAFIVFYTRKVVTVGIFKDKMSYWSFFVQEGAMTLFITITLCLSFLQWGQGAGLSERTLFQIEVSQISAIGIAFFVEVLGLLAAILGLFLRISIAIKRKCLSCRQMRKERINQVSDHKQMKMQEEKGKEDIENEEEWMHEDKIEEDVSGVPKNDRF